MKNNDENNKQPNTLTVVNIFLDQDDILSCICRFVSAGTQYTFDGNFVFRDQLMFPVYLRPHHNTYGTVNCLTLDFVFGPCQQGHYYPRCQCTAIKFHVSTAEGSNNQQNDLL